MEHAFYPLLLFFMCITMSFAQDFLQNPGFENPPANVTTINSTSQFLLLNRSNTIPGWSFNGTILYVSSGENLSFPGNGHALQLSENGTIRQTFVSNSDIGYDYVLTFNLIVQNEYCANNHTAVNVSVRGNRSFLDRSKVFFFDGNLSRNLWQRYGFFLGNGETVDLEIESVATNSSQNNVTCWPIVDAFHVKRNHMPIWYSGVNNILSNGDFEVGPSFTNTSTDGIILTSDENTQNSPLQQWSIFGTIKYIDSIHYKVPHAKAAIQLLSGAPSGIEIDLNLRTDISYTLNFTIGDANDSCVGNLMLYVQISNDVHNFTFLSNGTGLNFNHSISFRSQSNIWETSIVFYSINETRRSDGVLCGPVLDNVILFGDFSYGERVEIYNGVLIFSLFLALVFVIM